VKNRIQSLSLPEVAALDMSTRTLIFVDVDGVLNVGMTQGENTTLVLSSRNMALARRVQFDARSSKNSKDAAECLLHLASVPLRGEDGTLLKFMCPDHGLSEVLVERLANIILAAGESAQVILSSSWRHERHHAKRELLERKIGKFMGQPFSFHDVTSTDRPEHYAAERLEILGDYLEEYCKKRVTSEFERLRVLVLDDFFLSPLKWSYGGRQIRTPQDINDYLQGRVRNILPVQVKAVYTYDEWMIRLGKIQASIGLQMHMFMDALSFLEGNVENHKLREDMPRTAATLLNSTEQLASCKTRPPSLACRPVILAL